MENMAAAVKTKNIKPDFVDINNANQELKYFIENDKLKNNKIERR